MDVVVERVTDVEPVIVKLVVGVTVVHVETLLDVDTVGDKEGRADVDVRGECPCVADTVKENPRESDARDETLLDKEVDGEAVRVNVFRGEGVPFTDGVGETESVLHDVDVEEEDGRRDPVIELLVIDVREVDKEGEGDVVTVGDRVLSADDDTDLLLVCDVDVVVVDETLRVATEGDAVKVTRIVRVTLEEALAVVVTFTDGEYVTVGDMEMVRAGDLETDKVVDTFGEMVLVTEFLTLAL